jgi:hypothetical protein
LYLKTMKPGTSFKPLLAGIFPLLLVALLSSAGCSLRGAAISGAAGAFSSERAAEVYSSDDDPELVRDAFPFGLKTYELLLAEDPGNRSLHLAAAAGFIQYASAFLDDEADMLEDEDFDRARELKGRAVRLYLRGRDYALGGLELDHEEFRRRVREDPAAALAGVEKEDVPFLFWAGAGWAGAIAGNPSDMSRVAELSVAEAIMRRVLELDESYGDGGVHEFFIVFEGGRSEAMGGSPERAREHYRRAVELSGGGKASPHVALASTVAVHRQDLESFRGLLAKALAVDVNGVKKWRLGNVLAQKKASWLLEKVPDLFLEYEGVENE